MWGPAGLADTLVEVGLLTTDQAPRMNKGGTIFPLGSGISITQTRAEHSSQFIYMNNGKREVHVGGEPVGFIIRLENGFTIYHMGDRSEEHTSELQSLMRSSYAVFCLKKKRCTYSSGVAY